MTAVIFLKKPTTGNSGTVPVTASVVRQVPKNEYPCGECGRQRGEHPGRHRFVDIEAKLLDLELQFDGDPEPHVRKNVPKGNGPNCWSEK